MNYIYLMFLTEIVLLITAFIILKDIISPTVVTMTGFSLATLCVIYNVDYWNVSFTKSAYIILTLGLIIIFIEEIIIAYLKYYKRDKQKYVLNNEKKSISDRINTYRIIDSKNLTNRVIIIMCCIFFVYLLYDIYTHGLSLGVDGLMSIGAVHESDDKLTAIARIGKRFIISSGYIYSFIFCHNVILCRSKITTNIFVVFPIILAILSNIVTSNRIGAVRIIIGFFIILYITWMDGRNWRKLNLKKMFALIKKIIIPLVIILCGFYYLREIVKGRENNITFLNYITYYFGSSIHLFSKAIYSLSSTNYFGELTFATLYDNLTSYGLLNSLSSHGIEFISIGGQWGKGGGNVFTIFYRPMVDYGIVGMCIFIAFMYFIYNYIYYFKIKGIKADYNRNRRIIFYAYFFWGILMSFYDYVLYADFSVTGLFNIILICILYWFCTRVKLVL